MVIVGGVAGGWFSWSGGGVTRFIWWWNSPHSFQRSEDNLSYSLKLQDIFLDLVVVVVGGGGGALAYIDVVVVVVVLGGGGGWWWMEGGTLTSVLILTIWYCILNEAAKRSLGIQCRYCYSLAMTRGCQNGRWNIEKFGLTGHLLFYILSLKSVYYFNMLDLFSLIVWYFCKFLTLCGSSVLLYNHSNTQDSSKL